MEPEKVFFESTNVQFHSRNQRPTGNFERSLQKAREMGSKEVRVYGKPEFVIDQETGFVYLQLRFPPDIEEKIRNGTLIMNNESPWDIDQETLEKIKEAEKRKAKNSTKVWHKHK